MSLTHVSKSKVTTHPLGLRGRKLASVSGPQPRNFAPQGPGQRRRLKRRGEGGGLTKCQLTLSFERNKSFLTSCKYVGSFLNAIWRQDSRSISIPISRMTKIWTPILKYKTFDTHERAGPQEKGPADRVFETPALCPPWTTAKERPWCRECVPDSRCVGAGFESQNQIHLIFFSLLLFPLRRRPFLGHARLSRNKASNALELRKSKFRRSPFKTRWSPVLFQNKFTAPIYRIIILEQ